MENVTRRRGNDDVIGSIRELDPSAADSLLYVENLLGRIRGEARACANKIVAGATQRSLGEGGSSSGSGGGGALEAVDRLDEIRDGLQRIVRGDE